MKKMVTYNQTNKVFRYQKCKFREKFTAKVPVSSLLAIYFLETLNFFLLFIFQCYHDWDEHLCRNLISKLFYRIWKLQIPWQNQFRSWVQSIFNRLKALLFKGWSQWEKKELILLALYLKSLSHKKKITRTLPLKTLLLGST